MSHLTYFKVQNFKCFDEIEVKDIGQFNLIVGDNNVGKTALMEAMMVDENLNSTFQSWISAQYIRGFTNLNGIYTNNDLNGFKSLILKSEEELFGVSALFSNNAGIVYTLNARGTNKANSYVREECFEPLVIDNTITISSNLDSNLAIDFSKNPLLTFPFASVNQPTAVDLNSLYTRVVGNDTYVGDDVLKIIQKIIPGVLDIRTGIGNQLVFKVNSIRKLQSASSLGFASNRFIELLLLMFFHKNQRLFIDEIDTGIHHSRLPEFLKTILTLAKELNVQLFMTTHSKECEVAFMQILEEQKELSKEFRAISLYRNVLTGKIVNKVRDFESFVYALQTGHDIR